MTQMTTERTVDANEVAHVLEEIMLCVNNPNIEVYSAKEAVVDIILNFVQEYKHIPYRDPTEEDYNDYAYADYEEENDEDEEETGDD